MASYILQFKTEFMTHICKDLPAQSRPEYTFLPYALQFPFPPSLGSSDNKEVASRFIGAFFYPRGQWAVLTEILETSCRSMAEKSNCLIDRNYPLLCYIFKSVGSTCQLSESHFLLLCIKPGRPQGRQLLR